MHPRTMRLERLFAAHRAVATTTKAALDRPERDQAGLFGTESFSTDEAKSGRFRCITMSLAEAQSILKVAIPPSARTVPTRKEHALLMICMAQMLDELAAISTETVPWSAIAAAQHLAVQVRDWIVLNNQVVMGPRDRMSESMAGRARKPDALNRARKVSREAENQPETLPMSLPASWHKCGSGQQKHADLTTFPPWKTASSAEGSTEIA